MDDRYPVWCNQFYESHVLNFEMPDRILLPRSVTGKRVRYMPGRKAVELYENGDADINIYRKDAKNVSIQMGLYAKSYRYDLTETEPGLWTLHLEGQEPGFYTVTLYDDGKPFLYEQLPMTWGGSKAVNFVDIPDPDDHDALIKDVPHGAVRREIYFSKLCGRWRECYVYTPAGYDTEPEKRYPVMYLLHGGGDNETSWFYAGGINFIMDNLIAEGRMKEAVVVCESGCAFSEAEKDADVFEMPGDIARLIIEDSIPYIETRFRTYGDKAHRAIVGFSMGSWQARDLIFRYPDVFDWIGILTHQLVVASDEELFGYFNDYHATPEQMAVFNSQHKYLFIGGGEGDHTNEDRKRRYDLLVRRGLKADFMIVPGYHEWRAIRLLIVPFLEKIF